MKIAILGWGSLIWDKRELVIVGDWKKGGPVIPVEFSRISSDGRLTLVIDEQNGTNVYTRYACSGFANLNEAISNLQKREGILSKEKIGFINLSSNAVSDWSQQQHLKTCDDIMAWAQSQNFEAVIWTALTSNFSEKLGEPYEITRAFRYFNELVGETKVLALAYVNKAPPEVDTPLRRLLAPHNSSSMKLQGRGPL